MKNLRSKILHTTVFLTGCAVLIFEVAAVRMLAPYYGSSLSVLSSVLSVILLALSLGYMIGGRLADRYPNITVLTILIAGGGLSMLVLLSLASLSLPTLSLALNFGIGPLFLSLVFFFVPAFCLGIDSPFVTKLLASEEAHTEGTTVGMVFFWSTIGSITGSLLAGYYCIPYFGLTLTLIIVSLILIGWSGTVYGLLTKKFPTIHAIILSLGLILAGLTLHHHSTTTDTILLERDGLYSHLAVFDHTQNGTTYRFLKNDANHSSAIIIGSSTEMAFSYTQYALLYRHMIPNPRNYLVLGGGAFTVPRHLHLDNPTLPIDTVETEPYLPDIAHQYFDYPTSTVLHDHIADARVFLQSTTTQYDVIFSDVFNSNFFIPAHLITIEFFTQLRNHMRDNGVAMFNYIGSLDTHDMSITGSLIATMKQVFPTLEIVALEDPKSKKNQNLLIVVRKQPGLPVEFGTSTIYRRFVDRTFVANEHMVDMSSLNLTDEQIFTDDKSASDPLLEKQLRLHGNM